MSGIRVLEPETRNLISSNGAERGGGVIFFAADVSKKRYSRHEQRKQDMGLFKKHNAPNKEGSIRASASAHLSAPPRSGWGATAFHVATKQREADFFGKKREHRLPVKAPSVPSIRSKNGSSVNARVWLWCN